MCRVRHHLSHFFFFKERELKLKAHVILTIKNRNMNVKKCEDKACAIHMHSRACGVITTGFTLTLHNHIKHSSSCYSCDPNYKSNCASCIGTSFSDKTSRICQFLVGFCCLVKYSNIPPSLPCK